MLSSQAQRYSARKKKDCRRAGGVELFLRHSRNTINFSQGISKQGDEGKQRDETRAANAKIAPKPRYFELNIASLSQSSISFSNVPPEIS